MQPNPYDPPQTPSAAPPRRPLLRWILLAFWIGAAASCYLAMAFLNRGRSDSDPDALALVAMAGFLVCAAGAFFQALFIAAGWLWRSWQSAQQAEWVAAQEIDRAKIPKISRNQ